MRKPTFRLNVTQWLYLCIVFSFWGGWPGSVESQILLNDNFNNGFPDNWEIVDEGNLSAPSSWNIENGKLRQSSQIHSEPLGSGTSPNELEKLGTYIWNEAGLAWSMAGMGDVNGDGRADLVWCHRGTGGTAVWFMSETGTRQGVSFPGGASLEWVIRGIGDINGDSLADFVWHNTNSGEIAVWVMTASGTRQVVTRPGRANLEWAVQGVNDINGDGRSDLLWRHTLNGSTAVWLMTASGTLQETTLPGAAGLEWVIQAVKDVNGDSRADLVWRNTNTGATAVWLMSASGTLQEVTFPGSANLEWVIQAVDDVNGDNRADLVWHHTNTGATAVWLMNVSGNRERATFPGGAEFGWVIRTAGDVNGDSRSDLVWHNFQTGASAVWLMNTSGAIQQFTFPGGAGVTWRNYRLTLSLMSQDSGSLGVMLRYKDPNNYYRFSWDRARNFRRLIKVSNGRFTLLAQENVPYQTNRTYSIDVLVAGKTLEIRIDGGQIFNGPVTDETAPLTTGTIGLYSWNNSGSVFDNVRVEIDQELAILSPRNGDFFTSSSPSSTSPIQLTIESSATGFPSNWGVQFVTNGNGVNGFQDYSQPFEWETRFSKGHHTVTVFMIDEHGTRQTSSSNLVEFGIGDYYVAFGDSITLGTDDDDPTDDISDDGRNSGGGYPPILNNLLTQKKGFPHNIQNEGHGGDRSSDGRTKIASKLSAHPMAQWFLVMFGTNDTSGAVPRSSGLGRSPGQSGYSGSYKDNMNRIVSAIINDGRIPVLAYVPIRFGSSSGSSSYPNPDSHPTNLLIRDYNRVIDELRDIHPEIQVTPPDFYEYFRKTRRSNGRSVEFDDNLHPNGEGYRSMAELWSEALAE